MTSSRTFVALAFALVLALARPAAAGDLDLFGFGSRASGMGGAFTALTSDWTATYYNPAGLIGSKHVNGAAGFQYAGYRFNFKSERGNSVTDNRPTRIDPTSAFTAGLSTPIALDEPDRMAFGIGLFLPTRKIVEIEGITASSEPQWVLYGNYADRLHVLPALAVKIVDGFSFGVGVNLFAVADGDFRFDAGLSAPIAAKFNLKLKPDAGASAGLFFQPHSTLSFGLTYRTERTFKVRLPVNVNVQGIVLPLTAEQLTLFEPHQVAFGTAWSPLDGPVVITADVTWMNWSSLQDVFLLVSSPTFSVPPRLRSELDDTFVLRLGAEWAALDFLSVRAGYMFRPTPAPDPDGVAAILDNDVHAVTFGLGFTWGGVAKPKGKDVKDPEEGDAPKDTKAAVDKPKEKVVAKRSLAGATFDLDLFAQYHLLVTRTVERPAQNDPLGRIEFGGGIWNVGVAFQARF